MPSDAEPSPLQLSGKRAKKVFSNTQLSDLPLSESPLDDDDEKNLSAEKDNLVKMIRRELTMGKGIKKKLKRVRLSNDFINKKKKKKGKFEEESAFYGKDKKFNDEYNYDGFGVYGEDEDEYKDGDEFVLDMNEDDGYNEENEGGNENENDDDDFGILGVLEKNNQKMSENVFSNL